VENWQGVVVLMGRKNKRLSVCWCAGVLVCWCVAVSATHKHYIIRQLFVTVIKCQQQQTEKASHGSSVSKWIPYDTGIVPRNILNKCKWFCLERETLIQSQVAFSHLFENGDENKFIILITFNFNVFQF